MTDWQDIDRAPWCTPLLGFNGHTGEVNVPMTTRYRLLAIRPHWVRLDRWNAFGRYERFVPTHYKKYEPPKEPGQ